jgi:hypothetical protein
MASDDYGLDDDQDYEAEDDGERYAGQEPDDDFDYRAEWDDLPEDWYDLLDDGEYEVYNIDVDIDYGSDT